jgi:hypothetical protein
VGNNDSTRGPADQHAHENRTKHASKTVIVDVPFGRPRSSAICTEHVAGFARMRVAYGCGLYVEKSTFGEVGNFGKVVGGATGAQALVRAAPAGVGARGSLAAGTVAGTVAGTAAGRRWPPVAARDRSRCITLSRFSHSRGLANESRMRARAPQLRRTVPQG